MAANTGTISLDLVVDDNNIQMKEIKNLVQ